MEAALRPDFVGRCSVTRARRTQHDEDFFYAIFADAMAADITVRQWDAKTGNLFECPLGTQLVDTRSALSGFFQINADRK